MIGIDARTETLNEGELARARARRVEAIEAHGELAGREIEVLNHARVKRIAVARGREGDHATIVCRAVRSARVRLAMREPDSSDQQSDAEGDVLHHPMQPATTPRLKPVSYTHLTLPTS